MDAEDTEQRGFYAWIHWEKQIVSFQKAEGFTRIEFPSHGEMFSFMIEKSRSGYRIQ